MWPKVRVEISALSIPCEELSHRCGKTCASEEVLSDSRVDVRLHWTCVGLTEGRLEGLFLGQVAATACCIAGHRRDGRSASVALSSVSFLMRSSRHTVPVMEQQAAGGH